MEKIVYFETQEPIEIGIGAITIIDAKGLKLLNTDDFEVVPKPQKGNIVVSYSAITDKWHDQYHKKYGEKISKIVSRIAEMDEENCAVVTVYFEKEKL